MVLADVTFTVELSDEEASALRWVLKGRTDLQIAGYLHVSPVWLKKSLDGLRLENTLNLVEATRGGFVSWVLHEPSAAKTG